MKRAGVWLSTFLLFGLFAIAAVPSQGLAGTGEAGSVVDYETIYGSLNADGSLKNVRLVDQLRVFGEGDITITDPAPTADFRNITGTGNPTLQDGAVEWSVRNLAGSEEFVTASTPDLSPPLEMQVTYYRNGEPVPGLDAVGKSGVFDIMFDVANVTETPVEVTYEDADGNPVTVTEMVPIPIVAELQLELEKDRYTRVEAPGADIVTGPSGNLVVRWSMVMVPPIGELAQSFTLTAESDDFELGPVRLTGVPVAPKDRPFLAFAEHELEGGVESATELYGGSTELSSNVDKLHDGTVDLLTGMEKLFAGAQELTAGLGEAFDGSKQLAAGSGEAAVGAGKLTAGLGDAHDGSGLITGGLGSLGSGLKSILGGLKTLSAKLPAAGDGATAIKEGADGISTIVAGLTGPAGLPAIKGGIDGIKTGADGIAAGATAAKGATDGIAAAAGPMGTGLSGAAAACTADAGCLGSGAGPTIIGAATAGADCLSGTGGGCGLPASIAGLAATASGAFTTISGGAATISGGAVALSAGIDGVLACLSGAGPTVCGGAGPSIASIAGLISGGAADLAAGIAEALAGLGSPGADGTLIGGTSQALAGVGELHAGSAKLTSGLGEAVAGSGELTAGLTKIADGNGKLATGLGEASSGSGRLADGIGEAKKGTQTIEQSLYLVNEVGLKEVGRQANATAADLARSLAIMEAQDERAANESLLYGPPSSDQAEVVVGGSGIVLTMDTLDARGAESTTRAIGVGIGFAVLAGLWFALRGIRPQVVQV